MHEKILKGDKWKRRSYSAPQGESQIFQRTGDWQW